MKIIKRLNYIHVSNGEKKELNFPAEAGTYGKKLFGRTSWSNYTVSARVKADLRNADSKAGLLIRVTEPSEGGEGENPVLGIHFFIGYSISFTGEELVVSRHRYDEKILGICPFRMEADRFYEICVEVQGDEISVCMEGESDPVLIVKDTEPITHGCPGIWAKDSVITVERADVSM